ncbi:hypothetical protein [Amycolatopsis sp. cmx-4-54]|uniref:hypothetical protein n=1 Tax=Amycolatopsis sp. cmx-4-54 TaxID=2790936 RepID=UPI00397953BC
MFVVYCPACDRRSVVGVGSIAFIDDLTPGMILTGKTFAPHQPCVREVRQDRLFRY